MNSKERFAEFFKMKNPKSSFNQNHDIKLPFLSLFILVTLCTPNIVSAQNSLSLTLQDAWNMALENNLSLKQVEQTLLQAEEEVKIQKTNYLPTLSASGSYYYFGGLEIPLDLSKLGASANPNLAGGPEDIQIALFNVGLNQPIFTGFRTRNLVRAAKANSNASAASNEIVKNQILLQVGQLYYQIQSSIIQQRVIEKSINRADNQLITVRNLFQTDQAIAFDTLEIANRKLQLQIEKKNIENLTRILYSKFSYLLKIDSSYTLLPESYDDPNMALRDMPYYLNEALNNRPELSQLRSLQNGAQYKEKALRSAFYPQVYASLNKYFLRPNGSFFQNEWKDFYLLGVNVKWEFWNWRRDAKKARQTHYEYKKLELQYQDIIDEIRQQIKEVYLNLENIQEQLVLQRQLVIQEEQRYRLTEDRYMEGLATALDLSDTENRLTEAELIFENYYNEWNRSKLLLEYYTSNIGK
jgi:outer membrane protein TolC